MLKNDLHELHNNTTQFAMLWKVAANAYLKKLVNHFWYLSERLVSLSFFSDSVPHCEKRIMAKALLRYPKQSNKIVLQQMPQLPDKVSLADLVGKDSWTLFQLLNADHGFLKTDPKCWKQDDGFVIAQNLVKNLNVVNDASERALGLLTAFNTGRGTKNGKQQEYLRSIVCVLRQAQHKSASYIQ